MDYLIKLLGDYSIGWAITVIAALVFLGLCYRKVEKYFSDKAIHEKEKNEQFKKVMDQINMYPTCKALKSSSNLIPVLQS